MMIVHRFQSLEAMSRFAAHRVRDLAVRAVAEGGTFTLALSGGGTPRELYAALAGEPFRSKIPWEKVHLFWGDERCVGPTAPESNYRMAEETLIRNVPVPATNVHRVHGELEPPEEAARAYTVEMKGVFGSETSGESPAFPRFDLILLGLGDDGHTASLFPDDPLLDEASRWAAATRSDRGKPPVPRVTLTLPVLNQARSVFWLVSGQGKRAIVDAILEDPVAAREHYPAARVEQRDGVEWFLDWPAREIHRRGAEDAERK